MFYEDNSGLFDVEGTGSTLNQAHERAFENCVTYERFGRRSEVDRYEACEFMGCEAR